MLCRGFHPLSFRHDYPTTISLQKWCSLKCQQSLRGTYFLDASRGGGGAMYHHAPYYRLLRTLVLVPVGVLVPRWSFSMVDQAVMEEKEDGVRRIGGTEAY